MRDGEAVPLTPKAFDILAILIERRGELLEKDELINQAWPDTVVEEGNLSRYIYTLRRALGEGPNDHHYIVTVPGRGYRFVASVKELEAESAIEDVHSTASISSFPSAGKSVASSGWVRDAAKVAAVRFKTAGVTIALITLLAGLTIILYLFYQLKQNAHISQMTSHKLWQATFDAGLQSEPTWSPDANMLAYSSNRGGNFDIWVKPAGEGKEIQVTSSPAHDWQPDWSPDGLRLAFRSEREGGGLFVVPALGGTEKRISGFGYRPRWSPDGSQILFYSSMQRSVIEGSKIYVVTPGHTPREVLSEFVGEFVSPRAAWHPDGRRISVWGKHRQAGWSFWTIPISGGPPIKSELDPLVTRELKQARVIFTDFQWSPSGHTLFFEGDSERVRNIWKVEVDPQTLRWSAGPERLTIGAGQDTDINLSRDGKKLAFTIRTERSRLWSFPFDPLNGRVKGEGEPITEAGKGVLLPELSSDGTKLAFLSQRTGTLELMQKSLDSGRETSLAAGDLGRSSPHWSRDGSRLIYRRRRLPGPGAKQPVHTLVISPEGSDDEKALTSATPWLEDAGEWSASGDWILGISERHTPGRHSIYLFPTAEVPHAETKMRIVSSHPEYDLWQPRFSPDGRWISFMAIKATDAAVATIYLVPMEGGPWRQITEGLCWDDKPRWSPDGRALYFLSNRSGFFNVWGVRLDPAKGRAIGEPFRLTHFENPGHMIFPYPGWMDITLGGGRLIVPMMEVTGGVWVLENVER